MTRNVLPSIPASIFDAGAEPIMVDGAKASPPMEKEAAEETYAYLTTTGRVTGQKHRIEIWFVRAGMTAYVLNGGGCSHWVKNVRTNPRVMLEIGTTKFSANARAPRDMAEDRSARQMLYEKYSTTEKDLAEFTEASSTVVVAFDLVAPQG